MGLSRSAVLGLGLAAAVWFGPVQGQAVPPSVHLGIGNVRQETEVWCWAAVAQQIIAWKRGPKSTPPQCILVGAAWGVMPPNRCCAYPQSCFVAGTLQQIQALILQYGASYSTIAPPADPMTIYSTLRSGRAIILSLQQTPYSGHVVVVQGMSWIPGPAGAVPVLHVNDPMSYFTQPVPFWNMVPFWSAAIVVN